MSKPTNNISREIKYINKDFGELRQALINYTKNYYPNTYSDFNESSPGMMLLELSAYVGDVLSFYGDIQLQESFLHTVNEKINLYNLAQSLGYKPKSIVPAQVDLDIFQIVPSIGEGAATVPDFRYALSLEEGIIVSTDDGKIFRTVQPVDFSHNTSFDPTNISIYSILQDGSIESYLFKKSVKAVEGEIRTKTYEFTEPKPYDKIVIDDINISDIISVIDADDEKWYEVQYLAQDLIPVPIKNIAFNDSSLSEYNGTVPYLLTYKQSEKRFVTRLRKDDRLEIQFGSGVGYESDEEIVPNPYNVGIGIDYFERFDDISIDPMNFLNTKTYGKAPDNTTLTVTYGVSSGIDGNVRSNTLTKLDKNSIKVINRYDLVDNTVYNAAIDSIGVNNPEAAYGGMNKRSIDVIREEAMANFAAQNRSVTKDDYILRCYTMPVKYGSVAKAYIEQDTQRNLWNQFEKVNNQLGLNLYILSYDDKKKFVPANKAIKENLRQYLRQYRMLTDAINIKDAFIVNIGIEYEIITRPNFNSYEVLLKCTNRLMELFDNDNMEINAPIFINKLFTELDKIEGVQTVQDIKVVNKYDSNLGYSNNLYDIESATRNNIIYPSLDCMCFEIKYPNSDIKGRVIDL